MQISRHWRMNAKRYRLQGVRYMDGEVSLQTRPASEETAQPENQNDAEDRERETVHAA